VKLNYKDVTIASRTYSAGEKFQTDINVPSVSPNIILGARIINATDTTHQGQFSIVLSGAATYFITNNYGGALTDALTIRFYYWS
jgi:hypothetical protein